MIVYPRGSGGAIEVQEGEVLDIYEVVSDPNTYRWTRFNPDNPKHQGLERVTRVKVQPTGRCSRDDYRHMELKKDEDGAIVYDENDRPVLEQAEAKPVVLLIIENITVVEKAPGAADTLVSVSAADLRRVIQLARCPADGFFTAEDLTAVERLLARIGGETP
ncbi:hypothetical protein [Nonomuraea sp. B19D2]|uniref:hypothetical protein n=1 Tax=Nonomuraea sp. B19D2 TaxID=3159561 RepID=UPI0032D9EED2